MPWQSEKWDNDVDKKKSFKTFLKICAVEWVSNLQLHLYTPSFHL